MLNRKQAAELLSLRLGGHNNPILEAVYSGSDEPTMEILRRFPDVRQKAAEAEESRIRADQDRRDLQLLKLKICEALVPGETKAAGGSHDEVESYKETDR